jgi:hypothetical protein
LYSLKGDEILLLPDLQFLPRAVDWVSHDPLNLVHSNAPRLTSGARPIIWQIQRTPDPGAMLLFVANIAGKEPSCVGSADRDGFQ